MQMQRTQIGSWYRERLTGNEFEVIAIDEEQTVEVQMLEGELCEYDLDSWQQLDLEPIEEPEDWHYAIDREDDDVNANTNLDNPVDLIEPDVATGLFEEEP